MAFWVRKVFGSFEKRTPGPKFKLRVQSSINFVGEVRRLQSTFLTGKKLLQTCFAAMQFQSQRHMSMVSLGMQTNKTSVDWII